MLPGPSGLLPQPIASAVAVIAMCFLAIDAGVVNSSAITERIEMAQASIANVAVSQHELAFAVQAWVRGSRQKQPVQQTLAID
ncbi:hypothetical protein F8237_33795 [Bradyrhizobium betae]|uniref:Uncharacterized protein n=1 Tax=Bradyrhizobium betae TaxID=244734 RepID=A0A5P6PGW9_9BRAD|nr:hypothetical protein F8237_33795 [Bradyrhizobium betae]